jgi:hypothetical protein
VRELRLLENGREDRTPVRAVRSGEASISTEGKVSETELLVNSLPGSHPATQSNQSDRGVAGDSTGPALDNSRSSPTATAVVGDRLSLESLILAQDERWRRA